MSDVEKLDLLLKQMRNLLDEESKRLVKIARTISVIKYLKAQAETAEIISERILTQSQEIKLTYNRLAKRAD